ncbi:hypothetical protein CSC45_4441 [Pseudomonas aeruginosa]|nr:hypothetical protein CSC30_1510 [Pseudomonas aeruginosa]RCH38871.1 hypothetical protein CSC45_4441 [Pseudomonas aeruginosa]
MVLALKLRWLCQHAGAGIQALSVIPDFSYRPNDLLEGTATFRPVAGPQYRYR